MSPSVISKIYGPPARSVEHRGFRATKRDGNLRGKGAAGILFPQLAYSDGNFIFGSRRRKRHDGRRQKKAGPGPRTTVIGGRA
jgi:hypothetical protein